MDRVAMEAGRVATAAVDPVVAAKEVDTEVAMGVPRMVAVMVVAAKVAVMAVSMDKVDTALPMNVGMLPLQPKPAGIPQVVVRAAMEEGVTAEVMVEVKVVMSMEEEAEVEAAMDQWVATIMRHRASGRIEETSVVVLEEGACPHMVDMEETWEAVDMLVVEEEAAGRTCTEVVDPCLATISAWGTHHSFILTDDKTFPEICLTFVSEV